jgi:purine-binding chemotaxis protein CheW
MSESRQQGVLLEERQALTEYLDSLLQAIPQEPHPPEPVPQVVLEAPVVTPEREVVQPVVAPTPPVIETQEIARSEEAAQVQAVPEGGPPEWGRSTFQCLGMRVAGLTLAVPLIKLNGIIEMPEEITPMPGHKPWFLGLVQHLDRKVKVVDIARIVLPEGSKNGPTSPRHVVLMDDSRWGIACEGITEVMTLETDAVRWRSSRGKRPWLAGTVIEHMCAILDVDVLARDLSTGAWGASDPAPVKPALRGKRSNGAAIDHAGGGSPKHPLPNNHKT